MTPHPPLPFGLTPGDFAGIGPEILLRLAKQPALRSQCVLYAPLRLVLLTQRFFAQNTPHTVWEGPIVSIHPSDKTPLPFPLPETALHVIDITDTLPPQARDDIAALDSIPFATQSAAFAYAQHRALTYAIQDALSGRIAGICTAPWNKGLLSLTEDLPPTGHTEVLQHHTQSPHAVMMLAGDTLRVTLATVHTSIQNVPRDLTQDAVVQTTCITAESLHSLWGVEMPHIAVLGLNPHAGEGGLMGHEETTIIAPALRKASKILHENGILATLSGPFSADTFFTRLHPKHPAGWPFDAVVCMYHDQGLIPLKLHHYGESANITLGLPILRTSPDHGTAYDIAGQGQARTDSTEYALKALQHLAAKRFS